MTPDAMAAALLERRDRIAHLLGDTYAGVVRPYVALVRGVMARDRIAILPATLRLIAPIADSQWAVTLFLCAAVDVMIDAGELET